MDVVRSEWLMVARPRPEAALRVVCFPHAGASAGSYLPVSHELTPLVDVLAIEYPGRRDRREEPLGLEAFGEGHGLHVSRTGQP